MTETDLYYYGLPSKPKLVARTGTTPWEAPTGPGAYYRVKELRPVGNHPLRDVWEDNLAFKLHALLDSKQVKWTSTDIVRIGYVGESSAPVILWIGVLPTSLSGADGAIVASQCRELLQEYNIDDVEVEIRESAVTFSACLAAFYYYGLPSTPKLVARTSTTPWKAPSGPGAYHRAKELRPVGNHALQDVWEDNLALKLHALLESKKVKWTSTDVVRIGYADESSAPVILWIGVMPASLSDDDGAVVASQCRELLKEYNIDDVEVEIRESVVTLSAGPRLLNPVDPYDPIASVCEPLTTTLGLPICAQSTPWAEGTGGFFITEEGDTRRLLLITARHVVFPSHSNQNNHFEHRNTSQPRHNVTLFGDSAFKKFVQSIQIEIEENAIMTDIHERRIEYVEENEDARAKKARQNTEFKLAETRRAAKALDIFHQDVSTHWVTPESRALGHVILSPPISSDGYTEDWAVIEIDASKVNADNFVGNVIDLGPEVLVGGLSHKMNPDRKNAYFTWPPDSLLKLTGIIPDDEMRHPTTRDQNNEPCIIVIKRGNTTGLTVGRANGILSYARMYYDGDNTKTSKEWAILPFEHKSGPFSERGDSGSVIVDGRGRIGGLLTSGAGTILSSDITYATPICFLLQRMQDHGLRKPNVTPTLLA